MHICSSCLGHGMVFDCLPLHPGAMPVVGASAVGAAAAQKWHALKHWPQAANQPAAVAHSLARQSIVCLHVSLFARLCAVGALSSGILRLLRELMGMMPRQRTTCSTAGPAACASVRLSCAVAKGPLLPSGMVKLPHPACIVRLSAGCHDSWRSVVLTCMHASCKR